MHYTMTLQSLPKRFINCLKEQYNDDASRRLDELEDQVIVLTYMRNN